MTKVDVEVEDRVFTKLQALKRAWDLPDIDAVLNRLIDEVGEEYLKMIMKEGD
jgi:hypothetical protein